MSGAVGSGGLNYFDRQDRIPNWQQDKIRGQTALILGVGGLGCSVALAAVRLGFKKIMIIDRDVVDYHNLNRQVLFSKADVGRKKVDAAVDGLKHHNIETEIEPHDLDVVKKWSKVVELARTATVLFNLVDVGDYFDAAAMSLALHLKIPLVSGGTFRTIMTVDIFPSGGKPCWACSADVSNKALIQKLLPSLITSYETLDFIPEDPKPTGASTVYVATICAQMIMASYVGLLQGFGTPPTRLLFYFDNFSIDKWEIQPEPKCPFCADAQE